MESTLPGNARDLFSEMRAAAEADFECTIPDDASLLRAHTSWQWMVVQSGGAVGGLLNLSDGLDLLIGR